MEINITFLDRPEIDIDPQAISITFLNGPEIKIDPQVGPQGEKGEKGDKPVKGIDYFTDADKAELVQAVLNQIPSGDSTSY